jgi:hypothetical protein
MESGASEDDLRAANSCALYRDDHFVPVERTVFAAGERVPELAVTGFAFEPAVTGFALCGWAFAGLAFTGRGAEVGAVTARRGVWIELDLRDARLGIARLGSDGTPDAAPYTRR